MYEHCENVSRYAELEARSVGLGSTLKIAGLLHDVGKLTDEFNEYIHKAVENPNSVRRGSINHSSAGAKYIMDYGAKHNIEFLPELIAYSIFSHHGLNDCVDENEEDKFTPRLKVDENSYQNVLGNIEPLITTVDLKSLLEKSEKEFNNQVEKIKKILNTHKPQVCYKHVFNKFLLNSIRNKEQTKIKKTVSADYGYSKKRFVLI